MNKRQKLVLKKFLNDEEAIIRSLKMVYEDSLKDISKKVLELDSSISVLQKAYISIGTEIGDLALAILGNKAKYMTPAEAEETIMSMLQSKVYQKKYQEALKKQVSVIFDKMGEKQFTTVSDYLKECYENGFIGTLYDLQGQDIPLCFPLDQEQIVRAVQLDSKLSKGLYSRLGEDVHLLKKKVAAEISRGIATGATYQQIARQLASVSNTGYNNAVRIARTEGHRIQCQAGMDACYKAKEKGADVVKQWDATLDDRTRESHVAVDGEIRELDEPFSNGLIYPGDPRGGAAEVINCRCALLQRARWALDEDELETLKKRAEYFGLDKTESFEDYKKKYLKAVESEKISKNANFVVENRTLESREYIDKFSKMTDDPDERREYYKAAKEILNHRSGQNGEDLYLYNTKTKKWYKSTSGTTAGTPEYTKDILDAISKSSIGDLVSFHNHPSSMPPSAFDINAALKNGYLKGYALCHNGKIYEYTASDRYIESSIYEKTIAKFKKVCYNEFDAQISALEYLSDAYGFSFKEVK